MIATTLLYLAANILTVLFFAGIAGSSLVVIISFVEDLKELSGD
jgi:hypothetical protein